MSNEILALASIPILGSESGLNDGVKSLFSVFAGCGLLLVWYFTFRELDDTRTQLDVEARRLTEVIRAREETGMARRESDERFRLAFEAGPLGMMFLRTDRTVFRVNPAFAEMLGYVPNELVGKSVDEITHAVDVSKSTELFDRITSTDPAAQAIEQGFLTRDGNECWGRMTAKVLRNQAGAPLYWLGLVENIGERKKVEDALKLTRFAVKHASDAFYLVGTDGRYAHVNEAATRATGYSRNELLSIELADIVPS